MQYLVIGILLQLLNYLSRSRSVKTAQEGKNTEVSDAETESCMGGIHI